MSNDNLPSIHQDLVVNLYLCENRIPLCPKCGFELEISKYSDPGSWECEECHLYYFVNITRCQGQERYCGNLVLNNDFDYNTLESRYCNILSKNSEMTCLEEAYGEQSQGEFEDFTTQEHLRTCNNPDCLCRRVL